MPELAYFGCDEGIGLGRLQSPRPESVSRRGEADDGYALYLAQTGGKHPDAKPLKGFTGAGVLEVVEDFDGDTYRTVYTVRLSDAVYVLHAFQKKSKRGAATPRREIDLIWARLRQAQAIHIGRTGGRQGREGERP